MSFTVSSCILLAWKVFVRACGIVPCEQAQLDAPDDPSFVAHTLERFEARVPWGRGRETLCLHLSHPYVPCMSRLEPCPFRPAELGAPDIWSRKSSRVASHHLCARRIKLGTLVHCVLYYKNT
eukprot:1192564-Prorocentrum_minimum.AAC.3